MKKCLLCGKRLQDDRINFCKRCVEKRSMKARLRVLISHLKKRAKIGVTKK